MEGRTISRGQATIWTWGRAIGVAAMLTLSAGGVRGEAMAKASLDTTDTAQAAPVEVAPAAAKSSDLPPAFQLPTPTVRHVPSASSDDAKAVALATTGDAAGTAGAAVVEEKSQVVEKPGTDNAAATSAVAPAASELETSSIRGSGTPAAPKAVAPTTGNTATSSGGMSGVTNALQVATALVVVIGLIFIGKALAKKFVPGAKASNGKGVIEILARYPLCKNQSIVLVRIGSQIVTLNQCKDSSQSVLVVSDPNEVAKLMGQIEGQRPNSIQAGFTKMLANARMDLEDPANDPEDRNDFELRSMEPENLDNQLEEMASAKRQLMQLRQQVRSVRDSLPRS